jgi:hypothetical protein
MRKENTLHMYTKCRPKSIEVSLVDFNDKWEEINKMDNLTDIPTFQKVGNKIRIDWIESYR